MIPDDLRRQLEEHDQHHLLDIFKHLSDRERANLVQELERVNLGELRELHARREEKDALPERERIETLPWPTIDDDERAELEDIGLDALDQGRMAYLVVAGGQGTRLGFDQPKGMFPIGPISKKTLFQLHAEKILELHRRWEVRIPFLVMTSPATDEATRAFFKRRNYFRLPPQDVWFFCQGTMPAVDLETGRLLLEESGRLCLSPNGHGGTITALVESGLLARLEDLDIDTIYYFQVDNPLVNLADYVFIGRHIAEEAQISSKVLPKTSPTERVGNFALVDGRCAMIEYSDLPEAWAHETDDAGKLKFWAANPAIHLLNVDFLNEIARDAARLPWHLARKKVSHLDANGKRIEPEQENALKFERFIFDILPQAERWTVLPITREEEFAPVKNKEGADTPEIAQRMMCDQAVRWLRAARVEVPEGLRVEISPLFALDAIDVQDAADEGLIPPIKKDTYIREPKE
jgi:UDP-N-acetylglucosamine/UDP-N-acetylgalactosamine diphosphorylase